MTIESSRPRILLVEDDNHIGRIIELALAGLGVPYEFVTALSAEEGWDLWMHAPFDLLLTDYNLRGMTGLQLVEQLKAHGVTAPMILVTAYDTPDLRRAARELHVAGFLPKPFFMDDLLRTVHTFLPQGQAREVNGR